MGLDMYLNKRVYVGAHYDHRKVEIKIEATENGVPIKIDPKKVSYVVEQAGYWRKANAIHGWFVRNVQDGTDDCQESYVSYEKLLELRNLCELVIKTKSTELLPPTSGFFFGSTDIDESYWDDLRETIKIISELAPDTECDYYYSASW